jgi:hypothetical protein
MNNEDQVKLTDAEYFESPVTSSIIFTNNSVQIGTLTLSDPMTFDGNMEESAKAFFEYICANFKISDTK